MEVSSQSPPPSPPHVRPVWSSCPQDSICPVSIWASTDRDWTHHLPTYQPEPTTSTNPPLSNQPAYLISCTRVGIVEYLPSYVTCVSYATIFTNEVSLAGRVVFHLAGDSRPVPCSHLNLIGNIIKSVRGPVAGPILLTILYCPPAVCGAVLVCTISGAAPVQCGLHCQREMMDNNEIL